MKYDFKSIASQFQLYGNFVFALPFGNGHINETFLLTFDQSGQPVRYILQKVNRKVFPDPEMLMNNFAAVTRHLAGKVAEEHAADPRSHARALELVTTRDGENFVTAGDGGIFRCYCFVENARSYEIMETPEQAFQTALAFGKFQRQLADLPIRPGEIIPHFHDTPARLKALETARKTDAAGRLNRITPELDFVFARAQECAMLTNLLAEGKLTERVTHNDTKLNNVLFDDITAEGCCVIDLDTVMPGLPHYDFGDMVRTGTSPVAEDEPDPGKVHMQFEYFEALLRGYLAEAGKFLTPFEKSLLPEAGKIITLECGIRFLTDYLDGDRYFRIHRPDHNLDRARTQFALVASMETQFDAMRKLCDSL